MFDCVSPPPLKTFRNHKEFEGDTFSVVPREEKKKSIDIKACLSIRPDVLGKTKAKLTVDVELEKELAPLFLPSGADCHSSS